MPQVLLKDAPGGERLISRLTDVAAELALFFVGEPDEHVSATLHRMRANLERDLAPAVGTETAAEIAEAFVQAVRGRRAEIETARPGAG